MQYRVARIITEQCDVGEAFLLPASNRVFLRISTKDGQKAAGMPTNEDDLRIYAVDLDDGSIMYFGPDTNIVRAKLSDKSQFVPA